MPFPEAINAILRDMQEIPYENLSKIIAFRRAGRLNGVLDTPEKLYRKSVEMGAGGTCYSLTYYLMDRMRQAGFQSSLVIGDKYQLLGVHCGLLFHWEGQKYLLDPGYMIFKPLRLPGHGLTLFHWLTPNAVSLQDIPLTKTWRMYTGRPGNLKFRFDFRQSPVSEAEFVRHWKATFYFKMMEYPVLNKIEENTQHYLQKRTYLVRRSDKSEVRELDRLQFARIVVSRFGISEAIVEEALGIILQSRPHMFLPERNSRSI